MRLRIFFTVIIFLVLSACSGSLLPSTADGTGKQDTDPVPTDAPVTYWENLPVLFGAKDGKTAGFGYLYSIDKPIDEVEEDYLSIMDAEGWTLSNRQDSDTGMFGGPVIILDYQRDQYAVNIMIVFSTKENYTMVMLTPLTK
jgi:hypothetical protein